MEAPSYLLIQLGFAALTGLVLYAILTGLKKALARTNFPKERQAKIIRRTVYLFVFWTIWLTTLSLLGVLRDFSGMLPKLLPLVLLPPLLTILYLTFFSKTFAQILQAANLSWLTNIQVFRLPVELLLWGLFSIELLPVQMTLEGRNLDILTGITAPLAAWLCFANGKFRRSLGMAWNIGGLLLLINIVTIAVLSLPTPFRYFRNDPANFIVAYFPVVFLPGALVPTALAMHLFSLKKLLGRSTQAG